MLSARISAVILLTVTTLAVATVAFTSGLLFDSDRIPHNGNVSSVGVGVFWDQACTSQVTSIDWGYLEPDSTTEKYASSSSGLRR